jgi:hypothetical protein
VKAILDTNEFVFMKTKKCHCLTILAVDEDNEKASCIP